MKLETYKLFAQLCESIVQEATTLTNIIGGDPAANKLISALHRGEELPHDQQYAPKDNISWSDINDTSSGAWVIIKFASGVGAIKAAPRKNGYIVVAVPSESLEVSKDEFTKGGDALNFFKQAGLGRVQQLYVGIDKGQLASKQSKRSAYQKSKDSMKHADVSTITAKFKPLWTKAVQAAIADVKGMAVTMIQNDAVNKARVKIDKIGELQSILDAIESGEMEQGSGYRGGSKLEYIKKMVNNAVLLTAAHFYPEETGELSRSYGGLSGQKYQGPRMIYDDLAKGDQKKLGMVLGFFKRQLISG